MLPPSRMAAFSAYLSWPDFNVCKLSDFVAKVLLRRSMTRDFVDER